ncbi:MAG TPA: hypothetical protein PKY30_15150, partial [Myxococcota bacterium]|nr:hypothetical protein [Myxococcota bacterium]
RRLTRLIQEEEGALEDATRQVAAAEGSLSLALSRWHSTADRALSGQSTGAGRLVLSVDLPDLRGSAFTRQEWPWLGVGAGAGAFWLPTGYLQNTATAFEAVPTFNLSAFLTVAPIRLGGELRTGGGKREVHGYQTLSEGELVAVDRLRLEHEQLGVWLDWLPLSGHLAWFSPSLGGGAIVTRDNLTAEIAGIDRDHPYNTPGWTLRGGLSFSPWNHYVQLRAQGEAVYFRGYGWAPSLGISLDYTPLSRRR